MKNFVLLAFCKLTTILDVIDKNISVPSDYDIPNDLILPLFMKRYGYVFMPSCMTGVILSQYGPNLKR